MNKRRIFCLCLAGLLILASAVTAFAQDRQGASGWQVTFDGKKMNSNFSTANMDDEIYAMQPGDTVELTIRLKTNFSGQADWYMKNEVLETLEDAGDAAGSAYGYQLTYTDKDGKNNILYSSESLGGDGRINGVGLHGATTTLEDYFYLDRMGRGDTGTVKLKVALDGETEGNDYQDTLARLQMDFAVEPVESPDTPGGDNPGDTPGRGGSQNPDNPGNGNAVQTGDDTQTMLYVLLMLLSGLVLLAAAFLRMPKDRQQAAAESGAAASLQSPEPSRKRRRG